MHFIGHQQIFPTSRLVLSYYFLWLSDEFALFSNVSLKFWYLVLFWFSEIYFIFFWLPLNFSDIALKWGWSWGLLNYVADLRRRGGEEARAIVPNNFARYQSLKALCLLILEFILVAKFSWKAISVATHPHSWPRWSRFIGRATSFRQQAGNFLPGKQKNEQMWKLSGRTSVKLRGNRGGMKKTLSCSDGWPTL